MNRTDTISSQTPIAYFRRGAHSGAIVVKVTKKLEPGESATQFVTIRRRDDIPQCEVGRGTKFFWSLFPKSYESGVPISVDDYVKYHRDRVPYADLERFHIKYVGLRDICIASNDSSSGNRAQFLYGRNRELSNPAVAVAQNLTGSDSAAAAVIAGAGKAETILAVYDASVGCASFDFPAYGKGTYILRINDLERRKPSGERPRKEIRRIIDVTW